MSRPMVCDNCDRRDGPDALPVSWFHVQRIGLHGELPLSMDICSAKCLAEKFADWQPKPNTFEFLESVKDRTHANPR